MMINQRGLVAPKPKAKAEGCCCSNRKLLDECGWIAPFLCVFAIDVLNDSPPSPVRPGEYQIINNCVSRVPHCQWISDKTKTGNFFQPLAVCIYQLPVLGLVHLLVSKKILLSARTKHCRAPRAVAPKTVHRIKLAGQDSRDVFVLAITVHLHNRKVDENLDGPTAASRTHNVPVQRERIGI